VSSFFKDTRRLTIVAIFAFHGVVDGTFFSRLADLQAATGLGDGSLGLALSGLPIGMFFGCQMASRPIEEAGVRNVLSVALPLAAAGPMLTALLASGGVSFFLLLLIQGAALAAVNVAMNVEADRIEAADERRILNRCHASWALGFAVAGLAGTGAVAIGVPPAWHSPLSLPCFRRSASASFAGWYRHRRVITTSARDARSHVRPSPSC
jgi:MFS family permease